MFNQFRKSFIIFTGRVYNLEFSIVLQTNFQQLFSFLVSSVFVYLMVAMPYDWPTCLNYFYVSTELYAKWNYYPNDSKLKLNGEILVLLHWNETKIQWTKVRRNYFQFVLWIIYTNVFIIVYSCGLVEHFFQFLIVIQEFIVVFFVFVDYTYWYLSFSFVISSFFFLQLSHSSTVISEIPTFGPTSCLILFFKKSVDSSFWFPFFTAYELNTQHAHRWLLRSLEMSWFFTYNFLTRNYFIWRQRFWYDEIDVKCSFKMKGEKL